MGFSSSFMFALGQTLTHIPQPVHGLSDNCNFNIILILYFSMLFLALLFLILLFLKINNIFEFHKNIFIKKYQKLENKGLVEVNTECEDLPYDVILTQKGLELIDEIKDLEKEWNDIIVKNIEESDK